MRRVILFGAMGDIGPTVQRHLVAQGWDVTLVPFPQNTLSDEAGYRRELVRTIRQMPPSESPLPVIPIGCPVALARLTGSLRAEFPYIRPLVESPDKVELLDSKLQSYHYFHHLGISVPECYPNADSVPDGVGTVFKRDTSFASHGVRMPADIAGLRNLIAHQGRDGRYMIQRRIEGAEYSVDAVRTADGVVHSSAYRVERSISHSANNEPRRIPTPMPQLESIANLVLRTLDYVGVCGFDFIVDHSGTPFLLEANPRLSGGIATQLEHGFDIPAMMLESNR